MSCVADGDIISFLFALPERISGEISRRWIAATFCAQEILELGLETKARPLDIVARYIDTINSALF